MPLSSKKEKEQLNNLFAVYNKRLGKLYSDYVKQLTQLGYDESVLESDALFNFDNFPQLKARLDAIFNDYYQNSILCYKSGITDGVALAYNHDNADIGAFSILSDKALRQARTTAAETFISNRFQAKFGLNLAQTVWNYCAQTKSEFEMAMSNVIADGLKQGTSAEELGKALRQYLNNPDMMYRRYHTVKVLKNGQKKDVVTWRRRRVIDGKVRFVEEPLEAVGMGVYRSARKNALRVARTEINAAYHKARNDRWQNEPFVIGQYIHVSPQHPHEDICDELEGRYPKDFDWESWHPQCMCTSYPIMIEGEEKKQFYERLMAGEDMTNYVSPFAVTDVPDAYKQYIRDNADAIVKAGERGKLAWHLRDNTKYWAGLMSADDLKRMDITTISLGEAIFAKAKQRHEQRTEEQIKQIQNRWNMHRRKYYNSLVDKVTGGRYVGDIKSNDLYERYYAIRRAVNEKKSSTEIIGLFERFKQGYKVKMDWLNRKVANNMIRTAAKYGETDVSAVQAALDVADYAKAREQAKILAKQVKAIQDDEAALSVLIPDVNKWHHQFTSEQLHGVYDAVKSKLAQWQWMSLKVQANVLKFEAEDFLGGNMHGVQQKYATWKVSQAAYLKKLQEVNDAIDWAKINDLYADVKGYKTQSKTYHKLVYDLNNAIASHDKDLADNLLAEAMQKKQSLIDAKLKRAASKQSGSIPFDADAYSQARKDAALWAKNPDIADDYFRPFAEADWKRWSMNEKEVGYNYTSGSSYINEPLYKRYLATKYGVHGEIRNSWADINTLSDMIEKATPFTRDVWLNRGSSIGEFFNQVGVQLSSDSLLELKYEGIAEKIKQKKYNLCWETDVIKRKSLQSEVDKLQKQLDAIDLSNLITTDLSKIIGKEGVNKPFMSTAHTKGYGFVGDGVDNVTSDCIYNIYCPKGTKGIYCEPYSDFGRLRHSGYQWDGKSGAHTYGAHMELEVILQRGTKFRVTKVERVFNNGKFRWFIDIEVIEQPSPIANIP